MASMSDTSDTSDASGRSRSRASRRWPAILGVALALVTVLGVWLWPRASSDDGIARDTAASTASERASESFLDEAAAAALARATVWIEVVSEAGEPIAGALVSLKTAVGTREERSDETGLASFASLLPGTYAVEVSALGYTPLSSREVLRPGVPEAAWTLRLREDPESAGAVRGVVWSAGAPVAGALVTTLVDGQAEHKSAVKSGPDGRFVLAAPRGARVLMAFHADHGLGERALGDEGEVVVDLPAPGFVEGRVTDEKGRPLPSFRAQVRLTGLPQGFVRALAAVNGGGREGDRAARKQLTREWVAFPRGDDDEPGSFRLGPVPAGTLRVVASADGRVPAEREATVAPDEVTRGIVLSLPGPLVVTGCVTDAKTGAPIRAARVHALRTDTPNAPDFGVTATDNDGCYRLLTTADVRHSVAVRARGYVTASVGGVIGRADSELRRDFALERSTGERGEGFRYVGIGAKLSPHDEGAQVLEVFTSGSAAGVLSPGDLILRVDGEWTEGLSLERIVELIVGEDGTEVELFVRPKDGGAPKTLVLQRRLTSSSG